MRPLAQRLVFGRNVPAEVTYIKVARKKLQQLKFRMQASGIKSLFDYYVAPDGTAIVYGFLYGEEQIRIIAPPQPAEAVEKVIERVVARLGFYATLQGVDNTGSLVSRDRRFIEVKANQPPKLLTQDFPNGFFTDRPGNMYQSWFNDDTSLIYRFRDNGLILSTTFLSELENWVEWIRKDTAKLVEFSGRVLACGQRIVRGQPYLVAAKIVGTQVEIETVRWSNGARETLGSVPFTGFTPRACSNFNASCSRWLFYMLNDDELIEYDVAISEFPDPFTLGMAFTQESHPLKLATQYIMDYNTGPTVVSELDLFRGIRYGFEQQRPFLEGPGFEDLQTADHRIFTTDSDSSITTRVTHQETRIPVVAYFEGDALQRGYLVFKPGYGTPTLSVFEAAGFPVSNPGTRFGALGSETLQVNGDWDKWTYRYLPNPENPVQDTLVADFHTVKATNYTLDDRVVFEFAGADRIVQGGEYVFEDGFTAVFSFDKADGLLSGSSSRDALRRNQKNEAKILFNKRFPLNGLPYYYGDFSRVVDSSETGGTTGAWDSSPSDDPANPNAAKGWVTTGGGVDLETVSALFEVFQDGASLHQQASELEGTLGLESSARMALPRSVELDTPNLLFVSQDLEQGWPFTFFVETDRGGPPESGTLTLDYELKFRPGIDDFYNTGAFLSTRTAEAFHASHAGLFYSFVVPALQFIPASIDSSVQYEDKRTSRAPLIQKLVVDGVEYDPTASYPDAALSNIGYVGLSTTVFVKPSAKKVFRVS